MASGTTALYSRSPVYISGGIVRTAFYKQNFVHGQAEQWSIFDPLNQAKNNGTSPK